MQSRPANLFLSVREDESNLLKVLDFGISKSVRMLGGLIGKLRKLADTATSGVRLS